MKPLRPTQVSSLFMGLFKEFFVTNSLIEETYFREPSSSEYWKLPHYLLGQIYVNGTMNTDGLL